MDYAYNLQGWIKGVNGTTQERFRDIGKDGVAVSIHEKVARDAFGYSLSYYNGDHNAVGTHGLSPTLGQPNYFIPLENGSDFGGYSFDLWNGNIKGMVTAIENLSYGATRQPFVPMARAFKYDQLNRLAASVGFDNYDAVGNMWLNGTIPNGLQKHKESFTYDANGNIQTLERWGVDGSGVALQMDAFNYNYTSGTG